MRLVVPTIVVSALAAAALATFAPSAHAGAVTHTHRVVVRPVRADGTPAHGWSVTRERGPAVTCDGASASAVSRDIVGCFPDVDYLPACWKSHDHTVLCLRDARTRKLVRVRYAGSFPSAKAPKRPSPLDLDLAGGQHCAIRVGGAWGRLPSHPRWVGYYSCRTGDVYGPASGDGVDRAQQPWTVRLWKNGTKQRVVDRTVATAYYVGTRR